jgi:hypothetical protein
MRVGKSAGKIAALRLDQAARASADAIRATGNEALGVARFLVRLGDHLQSSAPVSPAPPSRLTVSPRRNGKCQGLPQTRLSHSALKRTGVA